PGVNVSVFALAVMPNGDLIAGGTFSTAGGSPGNGIARWNGASWTPLGTGVNTPAVNALAVMPGGDLIAGGEFSSAGGVPSTTFIARWNGAAWLSMGATNVFGNAVHGLAVTSAGNLVAGGNFSEIPGGIPV